MGGKVSPHICVRDELDSLRRHQINAALHHSFFQLHARNAVHQEAATAVGALEHSHPMTNAIELGGAGEASGARTEHCDLPTCTHGRILGHNPALCKATFYD